MQTTTTTHEGTAHYLTWPTAETYACGANAVGRRNTRTDTDIHLTTCAPCIEVAHSIGKVS